MGLGVGIGIGIGLWLEPLAPTKTPTVSGPPDCAPRMSNPRHSCSLARVRVRVRVRVRG